MSKVKNSGVKSEGKKFCICHIMILDILQSKNENAMFSWCFLKQFDGR